MSKDFRGTKRLPWRGYISPIWGKFPTQPNLNEIAIWVGVVDIINHTKFGNDRSREYKVTEGQILPRSTKMACCL